MGKAQAYGWAVVGAVEKQNFPSSVNKSCSKERLQFEKRECKPVCFELRSITLYRTNVVFPIFVKFMSTDYY